MWRLLRSALCIAGLACAGQPEDQAIIEGSVGVFPQGEAPPSARLSRISGHCGFAFRAPQPETGAPQVLRETDPGLSDYAFELYRFEVAPQGLLSGCLLVEAARQAGPRTRLQFVSALADLEMPVVVVWDSRLEVSETSGGLIVTVPPPPYPVASADLRIAWEAAERVGHLEVALTSSELTAWRALAVTGTAMFSPEVLEDFPAPRATAHQLSVTHVEGGLPSELGLGLATTRDLGIDIGSVPSELVRGSMVPASRGVSCRLLGQSMTPCPVTDGALDWVTISPPAGEVEWTDLLEINFDRTVRPRRVVIRGYGSIATHHQLRIDGRTDGGWVQLGQFPGSTYVLDGHLGPSYSDFVGALYTEYALESSAEVDALRFAPVVPLSGPVTLQEVSVFE